MINQEIKIGISLRIIDAQNYKEKRDALSHDWPILFEKLKLIPIFIPNSLNDPKAFLDSVGIQGIILSGGDNIGDFPDRDKTEIKLLDYGIKHTIPIFGVCRGMQVINKYFGGTISKNLTSSHVGKPHEIDIINPNISEYLKTKLVKVNSYHNNIITENDLGNDLKIFAKSIHDNSVEGFFHKQYKIIGVMWHPERHSNQNPEFVLKQTFLDNNFWNSIL
jgi:putative glutamine amidotransferase